MRTDYPRHIPGFDYLGCYRYFLTFCCEDRLRAFDDCEAVSLVTSQFLRAAADEGFAIIAGCFMPDHTHVVVEGLEDRSDAKRFISRTKQLSAYHYKQRFGKRLWQKYSYEHVLHEEEDTRAVIAYVLENPVRANLVDTVYEWSHII